MDKVVQQNAADSEESASASEELSSQASELKNMVQELILLVHGTNGHIQNGGKHKELIRAGNQRSRLKSRQKNNESGTSQKISESKKQKSNTDQVIPLDDSEFKNF